MTAAGLPSGGADSSSLSIGSVLDALRADFPEITISKIRFLESEGLIHPARTPAGYRQFTHSDIARLRFVLAAQRDHYLPLKVIRAKLEEFDGSPGGGVPTLEPDGPTNGSGGAAPAASGAPADAARADVAARSDVAAPPTRSRLTAVGASWEDGAGSGSTAPGGGPGGGAPRGGGPGGGPGEGPSAIGRPAERAGTVDRAALLAQDGVDAALLDGLDHHGILRPDAEGRYDAQAPDLARIAGALARLGVEPRLLRSARASADRDVGLLAQLVTPVARSRGPEAARRAEALSSDLASLSGQLHALLVGVGLRHEIRP